MSAIHKNAGPCLVAKGKVRVLAYSEKTVVTGEGMIFKIPAVMKLIRTLYRSKAPFNKRNVLIRDGFKYLYCGNKEGKLTLG